MRKMRAAVLLVLVSVAPAVAAGPFDGVWQVTEQHPTLGSAISVVFVSQNDAAAQSSGGINLVLGVLRLGTAWRVGAGNISDDTVYDTYVFDQNVAPVGIIAGSFTDPTHFQGTLFYYPNGPSAPLFGVRIF